MEPDWNCAIALQGRGLRSDRSQHECNAPPSALLKEDAYRPKEHIYTLSQCRPSFINRSLSGIANTGFVFIQKQPQVHSTILYGGVFFHHQVHCLMHHILQESHFKFGCPCKVSFFKRQKLVKVFYFQKSLWLWKEHLKLGGMSTKCKIKTTNRSMLFNAQVTWNLKDVQLAWNKIWKISIPVWEIKLKKSQQLKFFEMYKVRKKTIKC